MSTRNLRRYCLAGAAAAALCAAGPGLGGLGLTSAHAQEAVRQFSVPSQPLAGSLLEIGRQAGVSVAVEQALVANRRSPAIEGAMTLRAALEHALAGSGLRFEFVGVDAVRIVPDQARQAEAAPSVVEEILVTATKRPENQRDVPIAVTALSQAALERMGPASAQDAMKFVPGVNFSSNGANSVNYTIRGVNTGAATGNVQSTVALYIDDLSILDPYYPKITTNLRLFDIERVEVMRGPQGTLFGSGALGGAIRVVTNKPKQGVYEAAVEAGVSTTDGDEGYSLNAMVNVPLAGDVLALRAVGYYQRDAGYVDNVRTGQDDINSMISRGGRLQLLFTPTDRLKLTAQALFQNDAPADSAYTLYSGAGYTFAGYRPNRFPQDLKVYSLTGEWDLGGVDLTSITTYADKEEFSRIDFTARSMAITGLPGLSTISNYGPSKTFNQEIRLSSAGEGRLQWLVGALYQDNDRSILEQIQTQGASVRYGTDLLVDSRFDRRTKEAALFGEASFKVTDRLKLTGGLRAFKNEIDVVERSGGPLNTARRLASTIDQTALTPKFAATFTISPSASVYAQAAKGFRIGQNNLSALGADPLSGEVIPRDYDPDSLWNYELGAKAVLFDRRLYINAAAFFIDWKDIQLASRTAATGLNYISNAGDAQIRGLELDGRLLVTDKLEVGGVAAVLDSELTDLRNGAVGYKGQRLPASARYTASSFVQYSTPILGGRGYARLDHRYVGSQIDRLGPGALRYGDFNEFGLRVGFDRDAYEIVLHATNLADSDRFESALAVQGQSIAIRQRPRTMGLTLRARY